MTSGSALHRVAVVGDALLDLSVAPSAPLRPGLDVPGRVSIGPGGQGANIAVRLARRGIDVTLLAGIADDLAGELVRDSLWREGVTVRSVDVPATGAVLVLLDADGERSMASQRAAFADGLSAAPPVDTEWLVVSGYLLLEPGAAAATTVLASIDSRRCLVGCTVPDAALPAWRHAADRLEPDLVIVNADEARRVGSGFGDRLVVTERDGATATIGETTVRVTVPAVGHVVDATGAGDAFASALMAEMIEAWPPSPAHLRASLEAAAAAAAEVTQIAGAQGWTPIEHVGRSPA